MTNKDFDKELILAIFNISGINGIEIQNIEALDIGDRSFCYICKNTEMGDLFIKIDTDGDAFSFVPLFKEKEALRKVQIYPLLEDFQTATGKMPKIFTKIIIPSVIEGKQVPKILIGKTIFFSELIRGHSFRIPAEHLEHPTKYDTYVMKNYKKSDIESMFTEVAKFHKFFEKAGRREDIEPFFQQIIEDYETIVSKLSRNGIIIEGQNINIDRYILSLNEQIEILYQKISGDKLEDPALITDDMMNIIKSTYNEILKANGITDFNLKKFDDSLHKNSFNMPQYLLEIGKSIILLESFVNIYKNIDEFKEILNNLISFKDQIPKILSLPDAIAHNDIHPLNFMKAEDGRVLLVDLERVGRNKRICDLGLTFKTNMIEDDEVPYSILAGYQHISRLREEELRLIYDFYILSTLTSFAREIDNMKIENLETSKHIFNPLDYMKRIRQLQEASRGNRLAEISEEWKELQLDGLDLATSTKTPMPKTYQSKLIRIREANRQRFMEI